MRFFWRSDATELAGYRAWLDRLEDKNRQQGTSAPTLALAWSGPLDLLGALATCPELDNPAIKDVTIEARSSFDAYGGNVRNHDLVLRGTNSGAPLVVCVEAKAGEPLGASVTEQAVAAAKAKETNPRSRGSDRLSDLVTRLCRHPIEDARVGALRYQLLTGWAGALAESAGMSHVVFVLHEFRTDQRPEDRSLHNGTELARFADAVLACELPAANAIPWCVRVPDVADVDAALYIAHVVTDARGAALGINPTAL